MSKQSLSDSHNGIATWNPWIGFIRVANYTSGLLPRYKCISCLMSKADLFEKFEWCQGGLPWGPVSQRSHFLGVFFSPANIILTTIGQQVLNSLRSTISDSLLTFDRLGQKVPNGCTVLERTKVIYPRAFSWHDVKPRSTPSFTVVVDSYRWVSLYTFEKVPEGVIPSMSRSAASNGTNITYESLVGRRHNLWNFFVADTPGYLPTWVKEEWGSVEYNINRCTRQLGFDLTSFFSAILSTCGASVGSLPCYAQVMGRTSGIIEFYIISAAHRMGTIAPHSVKSYPHLKPYKDADIKRRRAALTALQTLLRRGFLLLSPFKSGVANVPQKCSRTPGDFTLGEEDGVPADDDVMIDKPELFLFQENIVLEEEGRDEDFGLVWTSSSRVMRDGFEGLRQVCEDQEVEQVGDEFKKADDDVVPEGELGQPSLESQINVNVSEVPEPIVVMNASITPMVSSEVPITAEVGVSAVPLGPTLQLPWSSIQDPGLPPLVETVAETSLSAAVKSVAGKTFDLVSTSSSVGSLGLGSVIYVGNFSILPQYETLYQKVWLSKGHLATHEVLKHSVFMITPMVIELEIVISTMDRVRQADLTSLVERSFQFCERDWGCCSRDKGGCCRPREHCKSDGPEWKQILLELRERVIAEKRELFEVNEALARQTQALEADQAAGAAFASFVRKTFLDRTL
ncbi:hypothetical protein BVC80_1765g13 [Macleaya cordata]|uniref:Uncharacterized protein n=1 Tax=Macleaya cordata TaxID=56857 RepID=A0A200QTC7_MACCD|nr:hypothetical protein BVC80_1765g13 [Macleaya cordata]